MFKENKPCSEQCVSFNKDTRLPTQCILVNCQMTITSEIKKIKKGMEK